MDEWDEFLARSTGDSHNSNTLTTKETLDIIVDDTIEEDVQMINNNTPETPPDLGDFGDNAEVLVQMARGESLNSLSSNGVWINSTSVFSAQSPSARNAFPVSKKRSLKSPCVPSIPVANTLQDLLRSLTGHPTLSHPLSLLKQQQQQMSLQSVAYEIDSLGLFFYGTAGDVKVEGNIKDDMMKVIEMKKHLIGKSIINSTYSENSNSITSKQTESDAKMIISHENLKLLAGSIPPAGKTSWIIPFTVNSTNQVDLSAPSYQKHDQLSLFYDYCSKSVEHQIAGLIEPSEHLISFDNLCILVKTQTPAFNISVQFRGTSHVSSDATDFLFYRQANYSIEVDFESLKVQGIKSFVPKFDQQNRLFLLLKALNSKLSTLSEGQYLLAHPANTPFIKILSFTHQTSNEVINIFESFLK